MNAFALARSFLTYRPSRSLVVILFVLLAVVAAIWSTAITRSVEANLQNSLAGMQKIGADLVVTRRGSSQKYTEPGNSELRKTAIWIRQVEDVVGVSSQLRLFTYNNCPWSDQPKAFVYAFDPSTDFTVRDWLPTESSVALGNNDVYIGNKLKLPGTQEFVNLAGMDLRVVNRLKETGTTLDDTFFVTFPTASALAEKFSTLEPAIPGLEANYVPVYMIALKEGTDVFDASTRILKMVPGVSSFDSAEFFRYGREQVTDLMSSLDKIFLVVWLVALIGIATVFLITLNERRREIGVLRVLGANRAFAFRTLIIEGLMLAIIGAIPGVLIGVLVGAFVLPNWFLGFGANQITLTQWLSSGAFGLFVALFSVTIATIAPIGWVFRHDPAVSMRG